MSTEKLAKLQKFSQDKVTFEGLEQSMVTESSYSQHEKDKVIALYEYELEKQKDLAKAINQIRRELLDPDAIFATTTKEICNLLEADRVAVYRFTPEWFGEFVAEFVTPGWVKLVGPEIKKVWEDTYLQETQGGRYRNNESFTVDDIYKIGHSPCHIELLEQFQAKAYIIAPILIKDRLWGLLAAYQNSGPRHWQAVEVSFLVQISEQFGVAVQQAELLSVIQAEVTKRKRVEAALSESKRQLQEQNAVLMELVKRKTFSAGRDLNTAAREITESATNTLRIERASVWLYKSDRLNIQCIDLYEWSKSHHSQGMELAVVDYPAYFQALQEERILAAHDAHIDPRTKEFSQFYLSPLGINSVLDAPIWLGGEIVGVVCHEHVGTAREWTLEEQNFAGSIADLVALAMKAHERKRAEDALQESEKKYRSVVDNIKEVIFQMDTAGEWTFLNHAWTEITGFSIEESIGTKFLSYVFLDDRQCTLDSFQPLIEHQKEQCHHEFRCLTKDGECRWIEVYARVNLDVEGNIIGTSGTLNDVTERLKVERMKNEFISTVSHELRTPLTSILGSLGLVTNGVAGEIPPSAKALLDIAHKNSERLVRLINDILDIEKIESGKMTFNLQPLELMPLLEQAIAANQAYGEQYKVKFILENTLVGVKVNADGDCLMQVLTNLLSNAAKFSPPDDTVVISVARHDRAIQVAITDRGSGIPEEFRSRVFQKFAQADSSATRQKGGTGLGLSITKAIVEKHNGQINFVTETNVGTTFYFYLPEWYEAAMTVVDNSSVSPQLPILICEDDGDIAALLKILLERSGFQADIAYDAAQAKQLLAQNQYAVMTLDIALPDIEGISLMRELRQHDSTHHLPIVVISARAELGRQELNGDAIAVIDWLDKPIDQTRLVAAVKQATRQIGSKPRILHIEDNSDVRQVVGAILQNVADICYAVNLQDAKQKLEQETFDLILLDLSLPDGSGLEVLPKVNAETGRLTPVVIFSAQEIGRETLGDVAAVLVKSRTSNQKLLETIQALTNYSSLTLVE